MSRKDNSVVPALRKVLAETFALYFNTHSAHWNVVGSNFASLHALFDTQYNELHASIDDIAERIRALDALAPTSLKDLLDPSDLKDGVGKTEDSMLKGLIAGHEALIKTLHEAIEVADEADDEGTEDLFIGRLRAHQKMVWMLKAQQA